MHTHTHTHARAGRHTDTHARTHTLTHRSPTRPTSGTTSMTSAMTSVVTSVVASLSMTPLDDATSSLSRARPSGRYRLRQRRQAQAERRWSVAPAQPSPVGLTQGNESYSQQTMSSCGLGIMPSSRSTKSVAETRESVFFQSLSHLISFISLVPFLLLIDVFISFIPSMYLFWQSHGKEHSSVDAKLNQITQTQFTFPQLLRNIQNPTDHANSLLTG